MVPVLRRPHRVRPLIESITSATPEPHRILFVCDPHDEEERRAIEQADGTLITCPAPAGADDAGYARKINAGVRSTSDPLIFLGADDLHFHPGWLTAAASRLREGIGVVGVNDLCSERVRAGQHATHFLMTRQYAQLPTLDGSPGPLCEEYDHSFTDDELVMTARARRAIAFATDSIVEHLHPTAGKAPQDDVYRRGRASFHQDRLLFRQRRARLAT